MYNPIDILGQALINTGMTIISFLPNIIIAVVVFALGWILGSLLGRAVSHIVTITKLDHALNQAGMRTISERAGVKISVAGFLGGILKWLVIVAFTVAATEILGLSQVTSLLSDILAYIPQVIVAALVLVMAALVADFVANIVKTSVNATGLKSGLAVSVTRWSILIVAGIFPALSQLNIAQGLVEVLFTGLVFSISLALGLAFGFGGKDAAAHVIEKMKNH